MMCGFNDIMTQVALARDFAKKESRVLIVDTRASSLWDNLDEYLIPIDALALTTRLNPEKIAELNKLSCSPSCWQGRIEFIFRDAQIRMNIGTSKKPLLQRLKYIYLALSLRTEDPFHGGFLLRMKFILSLPSRFGVKRKDILPGADLLVVNQAGGGNQGIYGLALFRLSENARIVVRQAQSVLGSDYDAIHIRDTDISSDYRDFLLQISSQLASRRVLVCSDNPLAIGDARSILSRSEVVTVTKTRQTFGTGQHLQSHLMTSNQIRQNNLNMLTDLICLAGSTKLFVAKPKSGFSGFSNLVQALQKRPDIIRQLVGTNIE